VAVTRARESKGASLDIALIVPEKALDGQKEETEALYPRWVSIDALSWSPRKPQ